MLRVNPKILSDLGLTNPLLGESSDSTQTTGEVFTKLGAKKVMKDDDANGDGVLSRDEVKISDAAYAKLDANSDGKVTEDELTDALAGRGNAIAAYYLKYRKAGKTNDMLESVLTGQSSNSASSGYVEAAAKKYIAGKDKDKNGTLEQGEVNLSATTFAKLDTNGDGKISLTEMKAALKGQDARLAAYFKNASSSSESTDLTSSLLGTI